jgi:hypothetical protein
MEQKDRPALTEVVISPAMIQAGENAVVDCEGFSPDALAKEVYLAMAKIALREERTR